MRIFLYWSLLATITGCGIESSLPASSSSDDSSVAERAVVVSKVEISPSGSTVTCEINDALMSDEFSYPIFIEFEGTSVESKVITNEESTTFNVFNPVADGNLVCVIEIADAEFESEKVWIESQ